MKSGYLNGSSVKNLNSSTVPVKNYKLLDQLKSVWNVSNFSGEKSVQLSNTKRSQKVVIDDQLHNKLTALKIEGSNYISL